MTRPDRTTVATALMSCALSIFELPPRDEPPDLDMVVIGEEQLAVDGYVMDSLGFAEWITVIEEQVDVMVMDLVDDGAVRTLGDFADALMRAAPDDQLEALCRRWEVRHAGR